LNKYEAMLIFPETLKEESLDAALDKVCGEIEKAGGRVDNKTRLGRRAFARKLGRQTAGLYTVVGFALPGDKLRPLMARFKLNEEIFRIQIVAQPEPKAPKAETAPKAAAKG
jgi:ribosomal protein S6